jgi:pseudouridylate synthase
MNANPLISEEVATAIYENRAVVALESTVISHGLPYPQNIETALKMEAAVREVGAVPATIGVIEGQITVGLNSEEIERLGKTKGVRKVSRRDFPIVVGLGLDGATTVAGTMIVAHEVGIKVFATGGIGGVHRGHPFDVSADLIELGRTPVGVVCSGAKSILDLPMTLETLETQGVPVISFGVDTLPAFYTRESGLPVDLRVDETEDAARIIEALFQLDAKHAVLIGVPVPRAFELDGQIADQAIQRAVEEADAQGVRGKDVTPFVLRRIAEITGDESKRANTALLENNASIAAQIAQHIAG